MREPPGREEMVLAVGSLGDSVNEEVLVNGSIGNVRQPWQYIFGVF